MRHASCHRSGFTFVELVIVIAILVALMAAVIAVWSMVRTRTAIGSTHSLVSGVAAQITNYRVNVWNWQDPATGQRSGHIFDLNHDGLIDGNPGVVASDTIDGGFPPEVLASGYRGFVAMSGMPAGKGSLANNQQLLDAWKRPLRIAYAAKIYGTAAFGVWSAGPDGVDNTTDDLCSW